jgi:hypothetical protein
MSEKECKPDQAVMCEPSEKFGLVQQGSAGQSMKRIVVNFIQIRPNAEGILP